MVLLVKHVWTSNILFFVKNVTHFCFEIGLLMSYAGSHSQNFWFFESNTEFSLVDKFPEDYVPTVFDNYNCTMVYNDKITVSLGLWDTAGLYFFWIFSSEICWTRILIGQDDYEQMRPLAYPGPVCYPFYFVFRIFLQFFFCSMCF